MLTSSVRCGSFDQDDFWVDEGEGPPAVVERPITPALQSPQYLEYLERKALLQKAADERSAARRAPISPWDINSPRSSLRIGWRDANLDVQVHSGRTATLLTEEVRARGNRSDGEC